MTGVAIYLVATAGNGGPPPFAPVSERTENVSSLLLSDMSKPSEELPHGVPLTYDWATHPRATPVRRARDFRAFTAWGQLYRCAQSRRTPARPVEFRRMEGWAFLRSTGKWTLLQKSSELSGASYPEDFKGATTAANVLRRDAHRTTVRLRSGYNFHFWPAGPRASLSVSDVEAVAVVIRARFARGRDRTPPCAVVSAGGDFWRTSSVGVGPGNTADAGIGRFKRVTTRWRAFTMTSASAALLARHPLPVRVRASETL